MLPRNTLTRAILSYATTLTPALRHQLQAAAAATTATSTSTAAAAATSHHLDHLPSTYQSVIQRILADAGQRVATHTATSTSTSTSTSTDTSTSTSSDPIDAVLTHLYATSAPLI